MWDRISTSTESLVPGGRTRTFFGSAVLLAVTLLRPVEAQLILDPPPPKRDPQLEILSLSANGWRNVSGDSFDPDQPPPVYTLLSSADLVQWRTAAVLLRAPFLFADPSSTNATTRYYRMALTVRTDANDWANQVELPTDPFFQGDDCETTSPLRWVKFAIVLVEPHRVVFQDSQKYRLHYEFAVARLPEFQGLSPEQFNGNRASTDAARSDCGSSGRNGIWHSIRGPRSLPAGVRRAVLRIGEIHCGRASGRAGILSAKARTGTSRSLPPAAFPSPRWIAGVLPSRRCIHPAGPWAGFNSFRLADALFRP
jgi:hypothetical protein